MVGFYAGAAMIGTPVILDGLISLVAALTLVRLFRRRAYVMFPSHLPAEKGGETALRELGIGPCLGLNINKGRRPEPHVPAVGLCFALSISNHRRSMKVASRLTKYTISRGNAFYRWLAERQVGTCRTICLDEAQGSLAFTWRHCDTMVKGRTSNA